MLAVENPVGFFFEALFRTGIYWNFLGLMQVATAALLLIPKTAFFGAIVYLPIAINILVIVCSMHFTGTPIVAGLMLLANLYLLVWDYPKVVRICEVVFR